MTGNTGESPDKPEVNSGVPVRKVPEKSTRLMGRDGNPHFFTAKQRKFLEVLSKTLDLNQALKESGMTHGQVYKSAYLMDEIKYIHRAAKYAHRGKHALGNHLRLMEKFEKEYDKGSFADRPKYAAVLAKMSDAAMKAAGEYGDEVEGSGASGVQVIINIGGQPSQLAPPEPVTIDAQVSDAG